MRNPTKEDFNAGVEALIHAANLARVASAFAQGAIIDPSGDEQERNTARLAVRDTLDTLVRDAHAAAERLAELL